VLTSYIFVAVPLAEMAINGGGPVARPSVLTLLAIVLALWFSVRITRVALSTFRRMTAVAFVAVEVFITYPLAFFAYGAVGLYPQA
jgi:hypothetical protein